MPSGNFFTGDELPFILYYSVEIIGGARLGSLPLLTYDYQPIETGISMKELPGLNVINLKPGFYSSGT
jgi:hypothetical protein